MPTPHNEAEVGQIAKVVLMPGDPLRARLAAQTYLKDVVQFNAVRGMLGYTGTYKGVPVSIMGSGMGIPSMAIYSYELYNMYGVETILRTGTAGGLRRDVRLYDIVFGQAACTDSNYPRQFGMPGTIAPICDYGLLARATDVAESIGASYHVGNLVSTDTFYSQSSTGEAWASMGVLAVEMEAAGLYLNAARADKKALVMCTISDSLLSREVLSPSERQNSTMQMFEIALQVAIDDYAQGK